MDEIQKLLTVQKDVKFLGWCIQVNQRTGKIKAELSTIDREVQIRANDEKALLSKIVDVLLILKDYEKWKIKKNKIKE